MNSLRDNPQKGVPPKTSSSTPSLDNIRNSWRHFAQQQQRNNPQAAHADQQRLAPHKQMLQNDDILDYNDQFFQSEIDEYDKNDYDLDECQPNQSEEDNVQDTEAEMAIQNNVVEKEIELSEKDETSVESILRQMKASDMDTFKIKRVYQGKLSDAKPLFTGAYTYSPSGDFKDKQIFTFDIGFIQFLFNFRECRALISDFRIQTKSYENVQQQVFDMKKKFYKNKSLEEIYCARRDFHDYFRKIWIKVNSELIAKHIPYNPSTKYYQDNFNFNVGAIGQQPLLKLQGFQQDNILRQSHDIEFGDNQERRLSLLKQYLADHNATLIGNLPSVVTITQYTCTPYEVPLEQDGIYQCFVNTAPIDTQGCGKPVLRGGPSTNVFDKYDYLVVLPGILNDTNAKGNQELRKIIQFDLKFSYKFAQKKPYYITHQICAIWSYFAGFPIVNNTNVLTQMMAILLDLKFTEINDQITTNTVNLEFQKLPLFFDQDFNFFHFSLMLRRNKGTVKATKQLTTIMQSSDNDQHLLEVKYNGKVQPQLYLIKKVIDKKNNSLSYACYNAMKRRLTGTFARAEPDKADSVPVRTIADLLKEINVDSNNVEYFSLFCIRPQSKAEKNQFRIKHNLMRFFFQYYAMITVSGLEENLCHFWAQNGTKIKALEQSIMPRPTNYDALENEDIEEEKQQDEEDEGLLNIGDSQKAIKDNLPSVATPKELMRFFIQKATECSDACNLLSQHSQNLTAHLTDMKQINDEDLAYRRITPYLEYQYNFEDAYEEAYFKQRKIERKINATTKNLNGYLTAISIVFSKIRNNKNHEQLIQEFEMAMYREVPSVKNLIKGLLSAENVNAYIDQQLEAKKIVDANALPQQIKEESQSPEKLIIQSSSLQDQEFNEVQDLCVNLADINQEVEDVTSNNYTVVQQLNLKLDAHQMIDHSTLQKQKTMQSFNQDFSNDQKRKLQKQKEKGTSQKSPYFVKIHGENWINLTQLSFDDYNALCSLCKDGQTMKDHFKDQFESYQSQSPLIVKNLSYKLRYFQEYQKGSKAKVEQTIFKFFKEDLRDHTFCENIDQRMPVDWTYYGEKLIFEQDQTEESQNARTQYMKYIEKYDNLKQLDSIVDRKAYKPFKSREIQKFLFQCCYWKVNVNDIQSDVWKKITEKRYQIFYFKYLWRYFFKMNLKPPNTRPENEPLTIKDHEEIKKQQVLSMMKQIKEEDKEQKKDKQKQVQFNKDDLVTENLVSEQQQQQTLSKTDNEQEGQQLLHSTEMIHPSSQPSQQIQKYSLLPEDQANELLREQTQYQAQQIQSLSQVQRIQSSFQAQQIQSPSQVQQNPSSDQVQHNPPSDQVQQNQSNQLLTQEQIQQQNQNILHLDQHAQVSTNHPNIAVDYESPNTFSSKKTIKRQKQSTSQTRVSPMTRHKTAAAQANANANFLNEQQINLQNTASDQLITQDQGKCIQSPILKKRKQSDNQTPEAKILSNQQMIQPGSTRQSPNQMQPQSPPAPLLYQQQQLQQLHNSNQILPQTLQQQHQIIQQSSSQIMQQQPSQQTFDQSISQQSQQMFNQSVLSGMQHFGRQYNDMKQQLDKILIFFESQQKQQQQQQQQQQLHQSQMNQAMPQQPYNLQQNQMYQPYTHQQVNQAQSPVSSGQLQPFQSFPQSPQSQQLQATQQQQNFPQSPQSQQMQATQQQQNFPSPQSQQQATQQQQQNYQLLQQQFLNQLQQQFVQMPSNQVASIASSGSNSRGRSRSRKGNNKNQKSGGYEQKLLNVTKKSMSSKGGNTSTMTDDLSQKEQKNDSDNEDPDKNVK